MLGKTHLAIGVASALVIVQPQSLNEIATAIIGGAVGGVLCDIDVKIDTSNKYAQKASLDALYGEIAAMLLSAAILLADWFYKGNICREMMMRSEQVIIGIIMFAVLIIIGERAKHREKTHSLLFMLMFTIAVGFINIPIGIAFFFGYASHLLIDLLNKAPEQLFFPLKKGICFKVCYADRFGNEILFALGIAVTAFYLYGIAVV